MSIEVPDPLIHQTNPDLQLFCLAWRFFCKHPDKNVGHFISQTQDADNLDRLFALLNHPDAATKQGISHAEQEVTDMVLSLEKNLGLNSSIERLKNQGNESIKDTRSKQELLKLMEMMRQKKS